MLVITGKGHPNITARHPTTLAFTRDKEITHRGDCFVAVDCHWEATPLFLEQLRKAKKVEITIECSGHRGVITASGHPGLTLDADDLVVRKSDWADSRTLAIGADKSANELSSELVKCLKSPNPVRITVAATT